MTSCLSCSLDKTSCVTVGGLPCGLSCCGQPRKTTGLIGGSRGVVIGAQLIVEGTEGIHVLAADDGLTGCGPRETDIEVEVLGNIREDAVLRLGGPHLVDAVDHVGCELLAPHLNGGIATAEPATLTQAEHELTAGHLEHIVEHAGTTELAIHVDVEHTAAADDRDADPALKRHLLNVAGSLHRALEHGHRGLVLEKVLQVGLGVYVGRMRGGGRSGTGRRS